MLKSYKSINFKSKSFLRIMCLYMVFLVSGRMNGQGASCSSPASLTVNGTAISGLANDTIVNDPTAVSCIIGTIVQDGWYSFVASATTATVIVVSNNRQLVIYAYSGLCGSLSQISCANANTVAGGQTETMSLSSLVIGNTYFVRVGNSGSGASITINAISVSVPLVPTITSLGAASGCIGSSIAINGTNLSGTTAANVKIGGTAVTSITSNSGTVLVAVIGTGTTGTVTVTTTGGTATSAATFTVNPLPTTPGNPTSNSPQCTSPGVTLTRFGSVPVGETWYWQTTALGTSTTSSGATYNVTTSGTYYIRSQNNTTGCWSSASGSLAVVINSTPTAAVTPSPTNAATGVCYSGSGAISSVSWAATAGATSYDVYFGAGSLPGSVTSNVATNSYTTGTLLANTTYYWKVVAKNACGIAVGSATWTFTTSGTPCACISTSTASTAYFSAFSTTGGTTNVSNSTGYSTNGYGDFNAQTVTQIISGTVNFSTTIVGIGGGVGVAIFVDWNQNGVFTDSGENVYNSTTYLYASPTGSFTVPAGASLGTTRMRIVANYFAGTPVSCNSGITGETEDYSFTVTAPSCYSTTANAATNITSTTATINWNAATVVPGNGYQYVVSTSSTTPAGVGTVATGLTANITGLTANTTYYVFVRSDCGSGNFSVWSPYVSFYTGFCISTSTSSTYYINNFSTTGGTLNITNNGSGYTATGYGNFTAQAVSQVNSGIVNFSTTFYDGFYTYGFNIWVDWNNDLDFNDTDELVYASGAYVTNTTGTITVPASASIGNHRMRIRANYLSTNPSICGSITSGETEDYTFTVLPPLPCSGNPSGVAATNITSTTATINWNAATVVPGNGYQYVVSTSSTTPAGVGTVATGLTANITGLTANTTYYVFVRSDCGSGNFSVWSPYVSFYTGFCISTSTSSTYYINNFSTTGGTLNITNNGSGYTATGYGNFTAQAVSQVNSGIVNFSTTFYDGFYTYGFNIWVDWNNDLDFNDTDELVYASGAYVTNTTGTITVPASASIGNHRMRIRANYLSTNPSICGSITSGETEDYTFTVLPPLPCSGNPSTVTATITSQTAATISWTAASPIPANGYEYFLSTTNTYPSSVTGSTAAGITTVYLTSLNSLTTYYVWVRSNCGGILGQGVWVGPISFTQPNCSPGAGTGTTTLGCPFVTSGGIGLSGANPPAIDCISSGCVDLEATYLQLGQTTNYTVEAIPYAPPYQFNCLQNPVSVNIDDVWSPVVNLPFNFCYYGNSYSSCVIGSNGILSFNSGLASTSSGYSFSNNLPSTTGALFANTIYGVYHDINPGVGGEVGWELITLNTGCRALVASWSNVPMFSDNTILYTGMMVLYENTNVIEVYIKEKNVDNFDIFPWNGGNAIVGVQNADGTAAVVAPGRNALDTNWEVANEAWRFTPSGTSLTSLKWFEGSGTNGPVVGTTDVLHVCPAATTTYTAEITYTLCNGTTIKEISSTIVTVVNGKIWDGSVSNDWNVADNWTPSGIPTSLNCVIIPNVANDPIIFGPSFNAYGLSLTILDGATLQINSNNTLTITDFVKVEPTASFTIKNSASLIQINNTAVNTGNIMMERITHVRNTDYVYWSSPVANFSSSAISPGTSTSLIFKWNPTIANSNGGEGNWVGGNETMIPGKGYIVRGPNSYTATAADYTAVFTSVPYNGIIQPSISRGNRTAAMGSIVGNNGVTITPENDNWNLVGNPYPSSIKALDFLSTNLNIIGNIRLWRHGLEVSAAYSSSFYATYGYNYSPTDYVNYNGLGANPPGFEGYIGAGQGFFILMNDGTATTENVTFNNSMRSNTYDNNLFYRASSSASTQTEPNKHRIWLSLLNASTTATTTLIGYTDGATYGNDRLYDAAVSVGNAMSIYSLINNKTIIIQGRPTPFDYTDTVPLGIKIETTGTHTIALSLVDGLFEDVNQGIYLEDTVLGIIHDLRTAPYAFTEVVGTYNARFILRYTNPSLGNNNPNGIQTYAFIINNLLQIQSNDAIQEITIYDITGKRLKTYQPKELKNQFETDFFFANGAYIAKITLENGDVVSKKLLH